MRCCAPAARPRLPLPSTLNESRELLRLGARSYFGERALLKREPRQANVVATSEKVSVGVGVVLCVS